MGKSIDIDLEDKDALEAMDLDSITSFPVFFMKTRNFIRDSYIRSTAIRLYELELIRNVDFKPEYVESFVRIAPLEFTKKCLPELENLATPEFKTRAYNNSLNGHIKEDEIHNYYENIIATIGKSKFWLKNYKSKISQSDDLKSELGKEVDEIYASLKLLYRQITKSKFS